MNATLPPPLPDVPPPLPALRPFDPVTVPFARVAAPAFPPPLPGRAAYLPAPVERSTRHFLHAALPAVLLVAALFLWKQYGSGSHFRHASTHRMIRSFDVFVFVAVCVLALLPIAITFACTVRRLEWRTRCTAGLGWVLAGVGVWGAVASSEAAFRAGKDHAYNSINTAALAADCAAMLAAPRGPINSRGEGPHAGDDRFVPAYTRSLGARAVYVSPAGVRVNMASDILTGANEEGWFVPAGPLGMTPQAFAAKTQMQIVSVNPPVFRYGVR